MRQFEKNQARFSQIMEKDDIVKFQRLTNENSASYLTNYNNVIYQSRENQLRMGESTEFMKTLNDTNSLSAKGNGRNSAFSRSKAGSNLLKPVKSQD